MVEALSPIFLNPSAVDVDPSIAGTATRRTSAAEQTAADRRADLQVLRATIQELRAENARERDDHAAEVAQLRARIATLEGR